MERILLSSHPGEVKLFLNANNSSILIDGVLLVLGVTKPYQEMEIQSMYPKEWPYLSIKVLLT